MPETTDPFQRGWESYWAGFKGGDDPPPGLAEPDVELWKAGWLAGFDEDWELT